MSVGTSDTTVISSPNPEARNLNAIDASAAPRDDGSPATIPTTTPKNRQFAFLFLLLWWPFKLLKGSIYNSGVNIPELILTGGMINSTVSTPHCCPEQVVSTLELVVD